MKRMLVLLFAVVSLLVAASSASAATAWKGVVVATDAKRGTVVTASAGGVVRTARSANAHAFKIGQRLDVRGTALADGTFEAATVKANGRAKTAKVKAVVVRWQKAQKRLLVSAGGSTFALSRKATRTLSSSAEHAPRAGDQITATVEPDHRDSIGDVGLDARPSRCARGRGNPHQDRRRQHRAHRCEDRFRDARPSGRIRSSGRSRTVRRVKAHVAVGTDGKLTLLSIRSDDDNNRDDDQVDDDEDEVEVTGEITALSDTSITVSPRSSSPVTCALSKPLTGFAVGDLVEIECVSGTAGVLRLEEIKHEDNNDDDNDDDDDHRGHGKGGGDDH